MQLRGNAPVECQYRRLVKWVRLKILTLPLGGFGELLFSCRLDVALWGPFFFARWGRLSEMPTFNFFGEKVVALSPSIFLQLVDDCATPLQPLPPKTEEWIGFQLILSFYFWSLPSLVSFFRIFLPFIFFFQKKKFSKSEKCPKERKKIISSGKYDTWFDLLKIIIVSQMKTLRWHAYFFKKRKNVYKPTKIWAQNTKNNPIRFILGKRNCTCFHVIVATTKKMSSELIK